MSVYLSVCGMFNGMFTCFRIGILISNINWNDAFSSTKAQRHCNETMNISCIFAIHLGSIISIECYEIEQNNVFHTVVSIFKLD